MIAPSLANLTLLIKVALAKSLPVKPLVSIGLLILPLLGSPTNIPQGKPLSISGRPPLP